MNKNHLTLFLTFLNIKGATGAELPEAAWKQLEDMGLKITDRRAQCYNHGSNMRGKHKGLQAQRRKVNSFVMYM